jgi:Flp pilus assembly protein TadD
VVLVYWPGASCNVVSGLLDRGLLPNLNSLVERGVLAYLAPLFPAFPASLYASAITGSRGDRHGILSSSDCDPRTGNRCAPLSTSLRSQPIWRLTAEHGRRTIAVGCPLLHPISDFAGIAVSREIFSSMRHSGQPWAPPPASVNCASVTPQIIDLCLRPEELSVAELIPFLPDFASIDQKGDSTVRKLAVQVSQAASLHAIATSLMEKESWDLAAVSATLIEAAVGQLRRPDENLQRQLLEACYRLSDAMLGKVIEVCGEDAVFMVLSSGAEGQRGFLCLAGAGTRQDQILHNVSLLHVAPTILHVLGCPVPRQMPGSPLTNAFHDARPVTRSEVSRTVTPQNESAGVWIAQLQALGYCDPMAEEATANARRVARERAFNLAGLYLTMNRVEDSLRALQEWHCANPDDADCAFRLYYTYFLAGRYEQSLDILPSVLETRETRPVIALVRAYMAIRTQQDVDALEFLRTAEAENSDNSAPLTYLIGSLYLDVKLPEAAELVFRRMSERFPECWPAHDGRAKALRTLGRLPEAAEALRHSLQLNFSSRDSHTQLAFTLLGLGDHAYAAQAFRIAMALP